MSTQVNQLAKADAFKGSRIKQDKETIVFNIIGYTLLTFVSLICLIPFWLIVAGSFTDELEIISKAFNFSRTRSRLRLISPYSVRRSKFTGLTV